MYLTNPKHCNIDGLMDFNWKNYLAFPYAKSERLTQLSDLSSRLYRDLMDEYRRDGRMRVVKHTTNDFNSGNFRTSTQNGKSNLLALVYNDSFDRKVVLNVPPAHGNFLMKDDHGVPVPLSFPRRGAQVLAKSLQHGTSGRESKEKAEQGGQSRNADYCYRSPSIEAEAQWHRAQINIIDERYAEFSTNCRWVSLRQVAKNELKSIDHRVYQFQIDLLKSVLMSPVSGIVTGIYKNPGDWVGAAEPVIRVENLETVLLLARLVYRGGVAIGSNVSVETRLFDSPGPRTTVKGRVVAMQGQQEDDQWMVIVECNNLDSGGQPIFPPGYQFDYDNTTVSIT